MGMRPSKDNFWSGDGQKRQPGFTQQNPGTNGELNAILAVMSTGPVGPSDGAGQHNATRIMRTCSAAGTILQPEKPMTPIDASYRQVLSSEERQLRAAAVWATYSKAKGGGSPQQYHILGKRPTRTHTTPHHPLNHHYLTFLSTHLSHTSHHTTPHHTVHYRFSCLPPPSSLHPHQGWTSTQRKEAHRSTPTICTRYQQRGQLSLCGIGTGVLSVSMALTLWLGMVIECLLLLCVLFCSPTVPC
jgi:hypothetical protein